MLRHNHFLLKVLGIRAVINATDIYELKEKSPVIVETQEPAVKIIITNGFHRSREVALHPKGGTYFFEVESLIDNIQLIAGLIFTILFFVLYIVSGIRVMMLLANVPVLMLLYFFYIKRKSFIQIHRLSMEKG